MQLIDADKAQPGMTIVAQSQTGGKGQRGKTWVDNPGQSLLMSVIATPAQAVNGQFAFNALVATTVVTVLQKLCNSRDFRIKWPNDIIVNDKKAGGILIENVIRGSRWTHCVIGLGINVKQTHFPDDLPNATSLKLAFGHDFNVIQLRDELREAIMECSNCSTRAESIMTRYNEHLYKNGRKQRFKDETGEWEATIIGAQADGSLRVMLDDGSLVSYYHGQVLWDWGR